MAFSSVVFQGVRGTGSGANTSLDITPDTPIVVGRRVLVVLETDNVSTTNGSTSDHGLSDSGGHTWTKLFEETETDGAAGDGVTVSVWSTTVTTEIPGSGDPITATFPELSDSVATIIEFQSDDSPTFEAVAHDHGASSGATLSSLTSREYLLLGVFARENEEKSATGDADYTLIVDTRSTGAGADSGNIAQHLAYRIATLTGDTFFPSDAGGGNKLISLAALYEDTGAGGTTVAVGTLAQVDSLVGIAADKPIDTAVGTLAQSDTQVGVTQVKISPVGVLAQTDSLISVSGLKTASVGVLAESDSLVAVPPEKPIQQAVGVLAQADTLQTLSGRKTADIGTLATLEALISVTGLKVADIGTLAETDALVAVQAQLGGDQTIAVGVLAQSDSLLVVSGEKTAPVGTLAQVESLISVAPGRRFDVATLAELEALIGIGGIKTVHVGTLAESNILVAVTAVGGLIVVHVEGRTSIEVDPYSTEIDLDPSLTAVNLDPSITHVTVDQDRTTT